MRISRLCISGTRACSFVRTQEHQLNKLLINSTNQTLFRNFHLLRLLRLVLRSAQKHRDERHRRRLTALCLIFFRN